MPPLRTGVAVHWPEMRRVYRTPLPFLIATSIIAVVFLFPRFTHAAETLDLARASISVTGEPDAPLAQQIVDVLVEEVAARTGLPQWHEGGPDGVPVRIHIAGWELRASQGYDAKGRSYEYFRVWVEDGALRIDAAVPHALLFAIGALLQHADWGEGYFRVPGDLDIAVTPHLPLRGHQLGYRARANSWDAWTVAQFDQHIRELAFFGTNAIENIPFQDNDDSPHFKVSRREMNRAMSEICAGYGLQYWVWTPAEFDLADRAACDAQLAQYKELFEDCPRLDGVFFPGGDPGSNPPELVMAYLKEVNALLKKHHPEAGVWMSTQGFDTTQSAWVYRYLEDEKPDWIAGIVAGPSTPPLTAMRRSIDAAYPLRDYPDITHTTRAQYPVPWWDPAFALTLGRECINPRPEFYADVIRAYGDETCGFISYSDGVHDDVNKALWSALGMQSDRAVDDVLRGYANLFFGPEHTAEIAQGILALEENWEGAITENTSIEPALKQWQKLEKKVPALAETWRGQMLLVRAEYDAYTRRRQIAETAQEAAWNTAVAEATDDAFDTLVADIAEPAGFDNQDALRASIVARFDTLYKQIALQTSMEKYQASGAERGCSLDFLDYPLNNRWWIADRAAAITEATDDPAERLARLQALAAWEDPGPGGFYDVVGWPGRSPHVLHENGMKVYPDLERALIPTQWWWQSGMSRERLTWQVTLDWPEALEYTGLDPDAAYTLKCTGYGEALPQADGETLEATQYEKGIGGIKTFPVPAALTADGTLRITWTRPGGESRLNWREQSRLAEVWLVKN